MADRRRQVILLLASRHDGLYLPAGSLVTPAGLVPSQREPCTQCGGILIRDDFGKEIRRRRGRGWVRDRYGQKRPCTSCGGQYTSAVEWEPGAGWIARDPMDAQQVRVGSTATTSTARPRATVKCDACNGEGAHGNGQRCKTCAGVGRRDLHAFELHLDTRDQDERDPLSTAIEARNAAGSYRELDRALAMLRARNRAAAAALLAAIDTGVLPLPAPLEPAVAFIALRMPDPIRVPADVRANAKLLAERRTRANGRRSHPKALEQRSKEWQRHVRDGRSPQWIAAEYRVAISTVYDVLKRRVA